MTVDDHRLSWHSNRSMPASTVIPVLAYPEVRQAVEWLCRAFGFTERLRIASHRSQLTFGDGAVIVTNQSGESGARPAGLSGHSVMVRVADVDEHYRQALEAGARISSPPTDYSYGERQYTAQDLAGHSWTFSQTLANVDPDEWGGLLLET